MQKLKVPRYMQWLVLSGIFFLFIMFLLRVVAVVFFKANTASQSSLPVLFFTGFKYDVRDFCIAALTVFIFTCVEILHPLDSKTGRWIALLLFFFFSVLFSVFYVVNFINYGLQSEFARGGLLNITELKSSLQLAWHHKEIIWVLGWIALMIIIFFSEIRFTYNIILSRKKTATQASRIFWAIFFLAAMICGIMIK